MNSNLERNTNPAKLKNQVVQDIKRVKEDLNQIKRSLTPGQLLDQLIFQNKAPLESLQYMKENPIGATFLTIGSLLLMRDEFLSSYESKIISKAKSYKQHAEDSLTQSKLKMSELKAEIKSGIKGQSAHVDKMKDKFEDKVQEVKDKTLEAKEAFHDIDPSILIMVGAGLGVLSGYSVPGTSVETKLAENFTKFGLDSFLLDLQNALNESVNLVKNEFLNELGEKDINFF
jgi:ElaB/YqjD/DUF883 family membrane-anchored ribosome-binding protein